MKLFGQRNIDGIIDFQKFMESCGYAQVPVIADGKLHRFNLPDRQKKDLAGWYVFYDEQHPAGACGDWVSGESFKWAGTNGQELSKVDREIIEARRAEQKEAERIRHESAQQRAERIWKGAKPADPSHPYLVRKKAKQFGIRQAADGRLVIPAFGPDGKLRTLQFIDADGVKRFLTGGKKGGSCFVIKGDGRFCMAEGYATGASIHEATGATVIVAFDAGNLLPVADVFRKKHPDTPLTICADNDQWTQGNPGLTKARVTADRIGKAVVVFPKFKDLSARPKDFNDLYVLEGKAAIRNLLFAAGSGSSFKIVHNEFVLENLMPIEWRIKDVLEDNSFYYDFGDPGSFKSFVALDRLLCIAAGIDYHGHKVKQGPTLYIAGEGHQGIGRRILAWHIEHGTKPENVPFFVSKTPTQLMDQGALDEVRKAVDGIKDYGKPAALHIDTLARNFGEGDENATKDMNKVIQNLDAAFGNDFCRGITHHTGHTNKDRARGSIVLDAAADIAFRVSKTESQQILVECKKMKDAPNAPAMLFDPKKILLLIGGQEDQSYVLNLVAEGDEAITSSKECVVVEKASGPMKKALDILDAMYSEYEKNLRIAGRSFDVPRVAIADWKKLCVEKGLYVARNFYRAVDRLEARNLVFLDKNRLHVYTYYIYSKYLQNEGCSDV